MRAPARRGRQFISCKGGRRLPLSAVFGLTAGVLGVLFFLLPGVRFSGYLLLGIACGCLVWRILDRYSQFYRIIKICKVLYLSGICALLLVLSGLEFQVLRASGGDDPNTPVSAVIVLGAGVNGTTPSLSLQTRIDAAAAYLKEHPHIPTVLSGGKGSGEQISEAEAMRRGLTARGIREDRLWLEDQSATTAENFYNSVKVLADHGLDPADPVAVVTNDFHLYRAKLLAERNGMAEPVGIPAKLPWWWLSVNYCVREAFATVKTLLFS